MQHMIPRGNLFWSSYVDAALVLLPLIGTQEAECMLIGVGVSPRVINRVLNQPTARRPVRKCEELD